MAQRSQVSAPEQRRAFATVRRFDGVLSHSARGLPERSVFTRDFSRVEDKTVRFRKDGLPISAQRVPGKPLMVRNPGMKTYFCDPMRESCTTPACGTVA